MTGNRIKEEHLLILTVLPYYMFFGEKIIFFTCNKLITALLSLPDLRNGPDFKALTLTFVDSDVLYLYLIGN